MQTFGLNQSERKGDVCVVLQKFMRSRGTKGKGEIFQFRGGRKKEKGDRNFSKFKGGKQMVQNYATGFIRRIAFGNDFKGVLFHCKRQGKGTMVIEYLMISICQSMMKLNTSEFPICIIANF